MFTSLLKTFLIHKRLLHKHGHETLTWRHMNRVQIQFNFLCIQYKYVTWWIDYTTLVRLEIPSWGVGDATLNT
jgi:hypothetical protein